MQIYNPLFPHNPPQMCKLRVRTHVGPWKVIFLKEHINYLVKVEIQEEKIKIFTQPFVF